jgi:putative phage-type endonuclease
MENEDQRSERWFQRRSNAITASALAVILGLNPYSSNTDDIILEKCGQYVKRFSNSRTEWGQKYEPCSAMIYSQITGHPVFEFGLLFHDQHGFLAASPDGIRDDGVMLEIKNVAGRQITGIPPIYYYCQVQLQLEVCDLERCDFLETEIKEYSLREYVADTVHTMKGCILMLCRETGSDEKRYIYSPLNISQSDYLIWKMEQLSAIPEGWEYRITYFWYLDKMSCIPIYRDREWFSNYYPRMRSFWDQVEHYRRVGVDAIVQKKTAQAERSAARKKVRNQRIAAAAPILAADDDDDVPVLVGEL